jgi:hypothetical protein
LPETVWTFLFLLLAFGILIFFGLMVRKTLRGEGCGCAGVKKEECSCCGGCTACRPDRKQ